MREVNRILELDAELPDSGTACGRGTQQTVGTTTGPIQRNAPEDPAALRNVSSLELFPSSFRQEEKAITAARAKKPAAAPSAAPALWTIDIGGTSAGASTPVARPVLKIGP